MQSYRDQGAAGALLDEYERAIRELQDLVKTIEDHELTIIVDQETQDSDCISMQSVLTHTVRAGII